MNFHKLPFDIQTPPEYKEELSEVSEIKEVADLPVDKDVSNISSDLILALKSELESFSQENEIIKNVLISTADGFEVASLFTAGYELHIRKVSALTSSLLGISSAMLKEVGKGEQNAVFMESDDSMILFNRIPAAQRMLCLMAVTSKDESIGQIFWRVRKLSDNVVAICNKHF
ncbi:hypothetical protein [Enterobacter sp.]|uniref:roadblock/LC7 domain-containing protein n=1 Tax=Enterobacter sp. TaxID=42895 RepID=UPI0029821161|nr:hypothetical protein [Enterobacter sp.]